MFLPQTLSLFSAALHTGNDVHAERNFLEVKTPGLQKVLPVFVIALLRFIGLMLIYSATM